MYEYKVVPAPQRAVKVKGLKSTADRFAHALAERINAEAAGGWEFLRTETLACEERTGFGRSKTSTQTVMVFGRALGQSRPDAGAALAAVQFEREAAYTDPEPRAPQYSDDPAPDRYAETDEPQGYGASEDATYAPEYAPEPEEAPVIRADRGTPSEPQLGSLRRQEPLFRSSGMLHGERPSRAEPVVRAPRSDRPEDGN